MANYAGSLLVNAQAKLIGAFQSSELRFRDPVVFKAFLKSSQIMFPNYLALRTTESRVVNAYYNVRTSRALGSARSEAHTGTKGESSTLTPSFGSKTDKFAMSLKQAGNNLYNLQEMFNNELQNAVANFAEGLETSATSALFAGRSAINVATVEGTFDATDKVFKVTESTNGNRFAQIVKSIMDINKYVGQIDLFCDTVAYNKLAYQFAQGGGNSVNLSFQFGGLNIVHASGLSALGGALAGAYTKGFAIAVPVGTYGVLPWIPKENINGVSTSVNTYGTLMNPVDGLSYAVHSYETRIDGSSVGGEKQDVATQYEISSDFAFVLAPLTTATESTLQAFALV